MSNSGTGKKYLAIGIIIAAAVGIGAVAVVAISGTAVDDDLLEPGTQIPGADTDGTPISPDSPPSDEQPTEPEPEPAPIDQAMVTVTPGSGNVGTQVTVQGTGFAANDAIAIFVDKQLVETEPDLVIANPSGQFSAAIIVPQLESGEYEVEAFGQEALARTTFTVN